MFVLFLHLVNQMRISNKCDAQVWPVGQELGNLPEFCDIISILILTVKEGYHSCIEPKLLGPLVDVSIKPSAFVQYSFFIVARIVHGLVIHESQNVFLSR